MLNKIIKVCIYLLVFLTPLFFLPFSVEALEFNKGYLLLFLSTIGLLAWLAKMIFTDKQVRLKRTPLDVPVLVFMLFMVLSSFLSVDKVASFIGFYGRFWPNLVGILSLGIFYFLITNNVEFGKTEPEARKEKSSAINQLSVINHSSLIKTFLWSSFFVTVCTYFSIFGVWGWLSSKLSLISSYLALPAVMLTQLFNPVAGSLQGLAMFLSVVFVFLVGLFACQEIGRKKKVGPGILLLLLALLLALIDFWQSWLVVLISLALFLAFSLWKRVFRENVNSLTLPILFFIISICFLFLNPFQEILPPTELTNLPQEVVLSQSVSWGTGLRTFLRHPVAGSGPGTFAYGFSRYKPESFMESPFWSLRFDRAGSHISEVLGTGGVLGFLSYLFLLGWFLMITWFILNVDVKEKSLKPGSAGFKRLPLLLCAVALIISQFLYYQNTTLAFSFFLFLGIAVLSWQKPVKEKVWRFGDFPEIGLVFNCCFWVLLIGLLIFFVMAGKFYLADTYYRQQLVAGVDDLSHLEKAVKWAGQRTAYHIALANAYRTVVNQELLKPTKEVDQQRLLSAAVGAINQGQVATMQSPSRVSAWEVLGMVYRDVRGLAEGAPDWAVKAFEEAIRFEPKNPAILTELGKLKVGQKDNEGARAAFAKAITARGEYWPAELQSALLDEAEGDTEKALMKMEDLKIKVPLSMDVHFQLGRLYYNGNRVDDAIEEFKQVILLSPDHGNAHFSLGLAYEKKGWVRSALKEFEKVLELNPGNEDIQEKIKALEQEL